MSIQTEIERIADAKQSLANWLLEHDVEVSFSARLDELVELLADVPTGSSETQLVPVDVLRSGTTVSFGSTITPPGTDSNTEQLTNGTRYYVPTNSLMLVYAYAGTGGSTNKQAYISAAVTGDVESTTAYRVASTSLSVKPILVCGVRVGTTGGTITFSKKTSSNDVM